MTRHRSSWLVPIALVAAAAAPFRRLQEVDDMFAEMALAPRARRDRIPPPGRRRFTRSERQRARRAERLWRERHR